MSMKDGSCRALAAHDVQPEKVTGGKGRSALSTAPSSTGGGLCPKLFTISFSFQMSNGMPVSMYEASLEL